ncbi:hypothetical protein KSB_08680 [Ktedonobacter robiniae]|uniref:Uncharacterized protein n=1 Tax=Ktedonobacter robiniae TaxID=2778365 RepID=A0ABQ3UI61_9CHLR|nr:hypothetical protein KSB_08680 [Ktedonobacter robiniae]
MSGIKAFDFKIYTNTVHIENKSIEIYHLGMKTVNISRKTVAIGGM